MCIGMCISIPPSIPHFGPNFGFFLAFVECITSYLTISLGTSPRPPGHLYISCGCVVCCGVVQ